jgi:hypothetical protein
MNEQQVIQAVLAKYPSAIYATAGMFRLGFANGLIEGQTTYRVMACFSGAPDIEGNGLSFDEAIESMVDYDPIAQIDEEILALKLKRDELVANNEEAA